jgi:hypothetical protein
MVNVGYGLGLHFDATNWTIPEWEKGLRKRLGWALYLQDKFSSLATGRPPLISSINWALRPVSGDDFPERHEDDQEGSSEVEQGRIMFSQMIVLTEILTEVLESIFTVKATREIAEAGDDGLSIILDKAKPVQLRLKEWFSQLPDCLSMESSSIMKLSSVGMSPFFPHATIVYFFLIHELTVIRLSSTCIPCHGNHSSPANHPCAHPYN